MYLIQARGDQFVPFLDLIVIVDIIQFEFSRADSDDEPLELTNRKPKPS